LSSDHIEAPAGKREPLIPPLQVTPRERNRLILVGIAVLVIWWLLSQSLDALTPFIVALVLGYLMLPLVDRLSRFLPRAVAILAVYLTFILALGIFVAWVTPLAVNQVREVAGNSGQYSKQLQAFGHDLAEWYTSLPLSQEVRDSIGKGVQGSLGSITGWLQGAVLGTLQWLTRALGTIVGFIIIPFWLFYVLKDKQQGIKAFNNMLPRSWRVDVWRIVRIVNGILSSYIRGQLILGLVVGIASTLGLLLVGAPYPILLGIISGLTELVPVVGPIIGAVPGLILASFSPEGWVLVLKVLAVYVVVQQLENNLLVPKIQGDSVKMHPSLIMVSLVVGSQVGGLFGLIVAVPVAAILRDVYLYLYRRFADGYGPGEAEASVSSRSSEQTPEGKRHELRELREARSQPGVNTTDELIADLREDGGVEDVSEKDIVDKERSTIGAPPDRGVVIR
jgi:predicted PurR-regulated permease PerM